MRSAFFSALLAGIPLAVTAAAPTCVADDLLQLLRVNAREARPFCRRYLGLESTSIVATVTPPAVTVVATETITSTHLQTLTVTNVETVQTTVFKTVVVETRTITSTSAAVSTMAPARARRLRRDALSAISDYPAESISSACSCLRVAKCGKIATATLPPVTETSVAGTVTLDATQTATATELATATVATTVTSSATATSVVVVGPPAPTTLPVRPFRLWTTRADGQKIYFRYFKWFSIGDVLYSTTNAANAVTFSFDSTRRLEFSSSSWNNGDNVEAFMFSGWFGASTDNTAYNFFFNTPMTVDQMQYVAYTWDLTWEDGVRPAILPNNTPAPVVFQLCPQMSNNVMEEMLHIGRVDSTVCRPVSIYIEFVPM
ncbi:hypothetical protein VTI74DRAFT_3464 [Chaetomium olivicolor]